EVAIAVQVSERRRGRPVAIAAQSGAIGEVFEGAVSLVAIEGIGAPARDKQVGPAVAVDVAHRHAVTVPAGEARDAGSNGHILKGAVATIPKETISTEGGGGRLDKGGRGEWPASNAVDINPAVAIVVKNRDAAAEGLGELVQGCFRV